MKEERQKISMLTTVNNPFNPFTEWEKWYQFDIDSGDNCCEYLARVAHIVPSMSEEEEKEAIDLAIETIIEQDPTNMYKRVIE
jgi:hypothetical protein